MFHKRSSTRHSESFVNPGSLFFYPLRTSTPDESLPLPFYSTSRSQDEPSEIQFDLHTSMKVVAELKIKIYRDC